MTMDLQFPLANQLHTAKIARELDLLLALLLTWSKNVNLIAVHIVNLTLTLQKMNILLGPWRHS